LAHIFVAGPKDDAAKRAKAKARAQEALDKAKALQPMDYQGFAALVREYSEEQRTKPLDGDMRFLSNEELAGQYGEPVRGAAHDLDNIGQVFDKLVETDAGFHVIKLQGKQAALNLTMEQVKPQLQHILVNE